MIEPLLASPVADEHAARVLATSMFLSVLDVAEQFVLPDLDPLLDAMLLVFVDEERWGMLRRPVLRRMGRMLCPKHLDPEARMLEFFGYEAETRYKNGPSYLQAIQEALLKEGEAGGLLRRHYAWFLSAERRNSDEGWTSIDDMAPSREDPVLEAMLAELRGRAGR